MALRAAELRRLLRGDAVLPLSLASRFRPASTSARDNEGASSNAYDVLGVGETSSSAEIKASFHRLAKETHPDVAAAAGSRRFLQILAAYEVSVQFSCAGTVVRMHDLLLANLEQTVLIPTLL
jgi:DnaJ-domain-containing protein 1